MLDISNTTKQNPPLKQADFLAIKNTILGKNYELSLAFVGDTRAQKLNKQYRDKTYIPNILSFPLDTNQGEIFINIKKVKTEARQSKQSIKAYMTFIFIHGCLHLRGHEHGATMEALEDRYMKRFFA